MSKQFWAVVIVIILVFVGIFAFTGDKSDTSSKDSKNKPTEHVTGTGTSGVTLLEYGDYQCPYCEQYYPVVKQVTEKYGDQIKFQFRNFPLVNAHPNAFAAARAAEAAGLQGKFWEMHDLLYDSTYWQQWTVASSPTNNFNQYAQQLGLNVEKFKTDSASSTVNNLINADTAAGTKADVTGTPSFFVNGKKVEVTNTVDSFSKVIDAEMSKQQAGKQ
jgi:protein-disulfide isomerase